MLTQLASGVPSMLADGKFAIFVTEGGPRTPGIESPDKDDDAGVENEPEHESDKENPGIENEPDEKQSGVENKYGIVGTFNAVA